MLIYEKEIKIPITDLNHKGLLFNFHSSIYKQLNENEIPIRFAVTKTTKTHYVCDLGIITDIKNRNNSLTNKIFNFQKRPFENTDKFNIALVVPTGIGACLGGHSGDAGALTRLFGSVCDTLITHPNVVNAADINELPENGLYVEGSVLSRLLMGNIGLQPVRSNRVKVLVDEHSELFINELCVNAISAARVALGFDCTSVSVMKGVATMKAFYANSGRAAGQIENFDRICKLIEQNPDDYDAIALSTLIDIQESYHGDYFKEENLDMVNPWGGVEAMLTHAISLLYDIPSAHSPMMTSKEVMDLSVGIVDPRKSAEAVSSTYLHCILKGLHSSPKIISKSDAEKSRSAFTASDVSCLVIPDGCVGIPTLAALEQGIPVIAVRGNKNNMQNKLEDLPFSSNKLFIVENYLEAVGIATAIRSGVSLESVKRPIDNTFVEYK